jgi:hypothetical protein
LCYKYVTLSYANPSSYPIQNNLSSDITSRPIHNQHFLFLIYSPIQALSLEMNTNYQVKPKAAAITPIIRNRSNPNGKQNPKLKTKDPGASKFPFSPSRRPRQKFGVTALIER